MKTRRSKILYFVFLVLLLGITVTLFVISTKRMPKDVENMKVTITDNRLACSATPDPARENHTLLLVNQAHRLDAKYVPPSLEKLLPLIYEYPISVSNTDITAQKQVVDALNDMVAALETQGLADLLIISGYRDYQKQEALYNSDRRTIIVDEDGQELTDIAPPGGSEHQTGLALDMQTLLDALGKEQFHATQTGRWIHQYGHLYGFVLRYPKKDEAITGIVFEPWHYRFVGIPHAAVMKQQELCLEEYLAFLREAQTIDVQFPDKTRYQVMYYQPNAKVLVPRGYEYTLSSDNMGGTIVTVKY